MVSLLSMFQRPPSSTSSNAKTNLQEFNKRIPSYPFMKYFKIFVMTWILWKIVFTLFWVFSLSIKNTMNIPKHLQVLLGSSFIQHQNEIMSLLFPQDNYKVSIVWLLFMWSSIFSILFTSLLLYSSFFASSWWYKLLCVIFEFLPLLFLFWMYDNVGGMLMASASADPLISSKIYQYKLVVFIFMFIYGCGGLCFVIYVMSASFQGFFEKLSEEAATKLVSKTRYDSTHFKFNPLEFINAKTGQSYTDINFLGFESTTCKTPQKQVNPLNSSSEKYVTPLILKFSVLHPPTQKRHSFFIKMGNQELIISKSNFGILSVGGGGEYEYGITFINKDGNEVSSQNNVSSSIEPLLRCSTTTTTNTSASSLGLWKSPSSSPMKTLSSSMRSSLGSSSMGSSLGSWMSSRATPSMNRSSPYSSFSSSWPPTTTRRNYPF